MIDYIKKLKMDLLEQFRGKPKIDALVEVIGRQFNDVYNFYEQMRTETDVHTAVGEQLDGIGEIVVMSRSEAEKLLFGEGSTVSPDDETYRQYLIYKILKNTCNCTYPDIIKAFKLFWDRPIYYSEDPERPATMMFDTGEIEGPVDTRPLFSTPTIRAAGVTLNIIAQTAFAMPTCNIGVVSDLGNGVMETQIPYIE